MKFRRSIKYNVDEARFIVEWFKIDLNKDKKEQVDKLWDNDYHRINELHVTYDYHTALDMARRVLLLSDDFNYAMIFLGRYEMNDDGEMELADSVLLGDVIAED